MSPPTTRPAGIVLGTVLLAALLVAAGNHAANAPVRSGSTVVSALGAGVGTGQVAKRPLLKPNARPLAANGLYVAGGSGQRVLRFESGLASVGAGVLEVRPNQAGNCPPSKQHASQILFRDRDGNGRFNRAVDKTSVRRDAGCMLFHPSHDHWHFEAAARYALWDPDRTRDPVVVSRRKMSFCLRDTERAPERWETPNYRQYYGDCHQHSQQGISIGWVDVYGSYLPGQSLKLPRAMPTDVYCLRTTVDPQNQLRESSNRDNHSLRAVRIQGDRVTVRPTASCRALD